MDPVTAVVLSHGAEPWLERCVAALLDSSDVSIDVVLVDNGCTDGAVSRLTAVPRVTVLSPGRNLGFAGGCNLGARTARGRFVAFINSDAIVEPSAMAALARVASQPDVGIATASLRLADDPELLNSAGNEIHFLGYGWAGHFGERADAFDSERDVTAATGAAFAMRREIWESLGGFEERYFLYHEDADLSLRCLQMGLRVVFAPRAIVTHRYEFERNAEKFYLLERNRLILVLTLFERRTIALLLPALVAAELATLLLSVVRGWWRQKLRGYRWLLQNRRWLLERRRAVRAHRVRSDVQLADRFSSRLSAGNYSLPAVAAPFDRLFALYWGWAKKRLRR